MRRPRPAPKRARQRFVARVAEHLRSIGAAEIGEGDCGSTYRFELPTPAGKLRLHAEENTLAGPGTVFGRFDDPAAAVARGIDCNPYSGKWNHHYFDPWTADAAVEHFIGRLAAALGEQCSRCPDAGRSGPEEASY